MKAMQISLICRQLFSRHATDPAWRSTGSAGWAAWLSIPDSLQVIGASPKDLERLKCTSHAQDKIREWDKFLTKRKTV